MNPKGSYRQPKGTLQKPYRNLTETYRCCCYFCCFLLYQCILACGARVVETGNTETGDGQTEKHGKLRNFETLI